MKFLITTLFISLLHAASLFAQCDEQRFRELIAEGDRYYGSANYTEALNSYNAAMVACKDKMPEAQRKVQTVFARINQLKAEAIEQKLIADKTLADIKKEKQKTQAESLRADSAINANTLQLYYYNSRDFATNAIQFVNNKPMQLQFAVYSWKMLDFANQLYNGKVEADVITKQALTETYLNNFGSKLDSVKTEASFLAGNTLVRAVKSNTERKLLILTIESNNFEQTPTLTTAKEIALQPLDLVTGGCILPNQSIIYTLADGRVFENEQEVFNTQSRVASVCYSAYNHRVYFSTIDGKLWFYNPQSQNTENVDIGLTAISLVAINNKELVYTDIEKGIYAYNTETHTSALLCNVKNEQFFCLAYNAETSVLAVAAQHRILLFDYKQLKTNPNLPPMVLPFEHKGIINKVLFETETNRLFSTCWAGQVMIWDLTTDISETNFLKPQVLNVNSKIFGTALCTHQNVLLCSLGNSLVYFPLNSELIYSALLKLNNNQKMPENIWKLYIKGDLEMPED